MDVLMGRLDLNIQDMISFYFISIKDQLVPLMPKVEQSRRVVRGEDIDEESDSEQSAFSASNSSNNFHSPAPGRGSGRSSRLGSSGQRSDPFGVSGRKEILKGRPLGFSQSK